VATFWKHVQAAHLDEPLAQQVSDIAQIDKYIASSAVTMRDLAFTPATLTVSPGTSVTWTNRDSAPHTVTSEHGGPLASKTLDASGSYSYTFKQLGTYTYYCTIHPGMTGTVVVQ
jgi:plastocyanin